MNRTILAAACIAFAAPALAAPIDSKGPLDRQTHTYRDGSSPTRPADETWSSDYSATAVNARLAEAARAYKAELGRLTARRLGSGPLPKPSEEAYFKEKSLATLRYAEKLNSIIKNANRMSPETAKKVDEINLRALKEYENNMLNGVPGFNPKEYDRRARNYQIQKRANAEAVKNYERINGDDKNGDGYVSPDEMPGGFRGSNY